MGEIDWDSLKAQLAELDNLDMREPELPDEEEDDEDDGGLFDYDSYESKDNGLSARIMVERASQVLRLF